MKEALKIYPFKLRWKLLTHGLFFPLLKGSIFGLLLVFLVSFIGWEANNSLTVFIQLLLLFGYFILLKIGSPYLYLHQQLGTMALKDPELTAYFVDQIDPQNFKQSVFSCIEQLIEMRKNEGSIN